MTKRKKSYGLIITNKELVSQNKEKGKRAAELIIAKKELAFQNNEKGKRAAELIIANKELVFQNKEKEKRAAELIIANKELAFQNKEKGKRAAELIIANKELAFQNNEKGKRAAELVIANKELAFQNKEKNKRATELVIANKELVFQNKEKEKRAAELLIANKELVFQNEEKEKRAEELIIANKELKKSENNVRKLNGELEQKVIARTAQLESLNKELGAFTYSVSHDLRAPLRAVNGYAQMLNEDFGTKLDEEGKRIIKTICDNAIKMGTLIDELLTFSQLGRKEVQRTKINMNELVEGIVTDMDKSFTDKAEIKIGKLHEVEADYGLFRQVMFNLISNALKYSSKKEHPIVEIFSEEKNGEIIFSVKDNGAGFDMRYYDKLFGVFQRLHKQNEFEGVGVGLAIVQRVISKHGGKVWAEGKVNEGATFNFSLIINQNQ